MHERGGCLCDSIFWCSFFLRREEREQRRNDIEHLATNLVGKVNECVAALDDGGWL